VRWRSSTGAKSSRRRSGLRVARRIYVTDDPRACVAGVVERLCAEEGVPQSDVVILSSHALAKSDFADARLGHFRLIENGDKGKGILFSSIRGFKGLESPAVILCELENLDDMTSDQQLYVGLSRARNYVAIVVPAPDD